LLIVCNFCSLYSKCIKRSAIRLKLLASGIISLLVKRVKRALVRR
jgi:hypothetical protein